MKSNDKKLKKSWLKSINAKLFLILKEKEIKNKVNKLEQLLQSSQVAESTNNNYYSSPFYLIFILDFVRVGIELFRKKRKTIKKWKLVFFRVNNSSISLMLDYFIN